MPSRPIPGRVPQLQQTKKRREILPRKVHAEKKGLRAKTGPKPKKVALAGEQAAEAYGLNYFIARRRERLGQEVNA